MNGEAAEVDCSQTNWTMSGAEPRKNFNRLLKNVHTELPCPLSGAVKSSLIRGDYLYFHYGCDGQDDRGWGCGYRTAQTMASWLYFNCKPPLKDKHRTPPGLSDIQQALVTMEDKPGSFSHSKDWIGTFEASLVLDYFYDVPCKLVHIRGGGVELEQVAVEELHQHFVKHGSPVMMGGDRDSSSKGILGVCSGDGGSYLLILDPHYYGCDPKKMELQEQGWVTWRKVSSLDHSSFYNLCMPQTDKQ